MNRSATAIESKLIPAVRGSDDEHDRALLRRYVEERDTEALGELLNRHAHAAFRLACHFSANANDAEDSVQAAAVNLIHHAGKFDHQREGSVRLWIMGIVVNVCRKKRLENSRRAAREQRAASQHTTITLPDYGDGEKAQLHQDVAKAVRALPVLYRAPLSLHYYEGLTSTEVAAVLQIPENTIRSQIKRGIERLREMLTASGISLSVVELGGVIGALQLEQAPASLLASLQETARQAPSLAKRARQGKKAQPRDNSAGWKVAAGAALVAIILLLLWMWNTQRTGVPAGSPQTQVASVDVKPKQSSKSEQIIQKEAVMPDAAPARKELAPVVDPGLKDPLQHDSISTTQPKKHTEEKDPMNFKNAILGTVLAVASAGANARAADVSKAPAPNAVTAVAGPVVPELLDLASPEITGLAVIPNVNGAVDHVDTLVRAFNAQIPAGLIKMQVGMMLNDPGLAHLDASKPVVAMFLKSAASDASAPLAIFVPAKADAPYAAVAAQAQWVSASKDGLLILASTADALKIAQGQTAAYNKIAAATISADTRVFINNANLLTAYGQKFKDLVSMVAAQTAAAKTTTPGMDMGGVSKMLNLEAKAALNILAQTECEQIDITLKEDAITIDTVTKAVKDSAMSDLFNTAPQDANKTLNYLTSAGAMAMTARFDPVRSQASVAKILKDAVKDPEFAEFLTPEVVKFANDWMQLYGGDIATTTSIVPKAGINMEFAMAVTDPKSVPALYDRMQVLTGPGGPLAKYYSMMSVPMTASLEKSARKYRGLDVMRYKTHADVSKLDPQTANTMKLMLKDMDIAVVKETYLGASNPTDLDAMIDRALDGKTDKPSVTLEAMSFFGPGKQVYFDYNFIELMKEVMAEMPANPLANLKQLSDAKPIIGAAVTENGRALLQVRIPLGPLTEMTTLMQKNAAGATPATPPAPPAPDPDGKNEKF